MNDHSVVPDTKINVSSVRRSAMECVCDVIPVMPLSLMSAFAEYVTIVTSSATGVCY